MDKKPQHFNHKRIRRYSRWIVGAFAALCMLTGTALAADMRSGESFRLAEGEVIADDLYVSAGEVIIDGRIEGDLIAAGGYIEINGEVLGDLIAAGGGVVINGWVEDDVRVAAGSITVAGMVGDDLIAAAGGGFPGSSMMAMQFAQRTLAPGLRLLAASTVGGDAYLAGGAGQIQGAIRGDLAAAMQNLDFSGRVDGDARLYAQEMLVSSDSAVAGTLHYTTSGQYAPPSGIAGSIERGESNELPAQRRSAPLQLILGWFLRTLLAVAGLALAGWLIYQFAPAQIEEPATLLAANPTESVIAGVIALALYLPVSAIAVFVAALLFGPWLGGLALFALLFGLFSLLWTLSPLVTGLWLGRRLLQAGDTQAAPLVTMLLGATTILLAGRVLTWIPCVGGVAYRLVYLASLAFALGALILRQRRRPPTVVADLESLPPDSPGSALSAH